MKDNFDKALIRRAVHDQRDLMMSIGHAMSGIEAKKRMALMCAQNALALYSALLAIEAGAEDCDDISIEDIDICVMAVREIMMEGLDEAKPEPVS